MIELGSGGSQAQPLGPRLEPEVHLPLEPVSYAIGSEPIEIAGLSAALRGHLRLIASVTIVAAVVTWIHLHLTPPTYRANAVVRLVDTRQAIAGSFDNPVSKPLGGALIDPIQSEIELLLSRSIASKVVAKHPVGLQVIAGNAISGLLQDVSLAAEAEPDTFSLQFDAQGFAVQSRFGRERVEYGAPATAGALQFTVKSAPLSHETTLIVLGREVAIERLRNNLFAKARDATNVVDVSYTGRDPILARQIVNAVITVFQESNAAMARDQSRRRRIFVGEQLRQTDSLLVSAQNRLSAYRSRNRFNSSSDVVGARLTALLNSDQQLQELRAQREVLRALLDSLAVRNPPRHQKVLAALMALPSIAQNELVQQLFRELVQYERTRDSLTTGQWSTAPTNPDLVRLEGLIATTQAKLLVAVHGQIQSLDAQISSLGDLLGQSSRELRRLPAMMAGEDRLRDQARSAALLANELRDEYQSARISEAIEAGDVEIIDFAAAPTIPVGPGRGMQLLAGSLVGLLLGITVALLRERANTAIGCGSDLQRVLQVPRLAVIPPLNTKPSGTLKTIGRFIVAMPWSRAIKRRQESRAAEALIAISSSSSVGAEAFRFLRTSLVFSQSIHALRIIVVTSPSPKDGKTTTAANLAVAFAQHGQRVLLIDCDLRRPRLHMIFHVSREPGLADVVLGRAEIRDALRATAVNGLDLLSAGVRLPNPADVLSEPRLHEVLATLAKQYDLLVLDTAPVHVATDATVLGRVSDGVLLVIRAGKTERAAAMNAVSRLSRSGVRVIGAVMNDADGRRGQSSEEYSATDSYDIYNDVTTS